MFLFILGFRMTDAINMEMKYERVISSTLQAYALFISKLPPDILQSNVAEHTDNILSTAKFWKLQKHESGLIRASWYHLMATLIEKCPQVSLVSFGPPGKKCRPWSQFFGTMLPTTQLSLCQGCKKNPYLKKKKKMV